MLRPPVLVAAAARWPRSPAAAGGKDEPRRQPAGAALLEAQHGVRRGGAGDARGLPPADRGVQALRRAASSARCWARSTLLRAAIARRDLAAARARVAEGRRALRVDRRGLRRLRRPRRRHQRRARRACPAACARPTSPACTAIELALWGRRSTRDAVAPAARPRAATSRRLRARVAEDRRSTRSSTRCARTRCSRTRIHLQLSGRASPWSGAALVALRGNVAGTRVVLAHARRRCSTRRDPAVARRGAAALDALDARWHRLERPDGSLPRWDALAPARPRARRRA